MNRVPRLAPLFVMLVGIGSSLSTATGCSSRADDASDSPDPVGSDQDALRRKGSCVYDGVAYASGASFASSDGCNRCSCASGAVFCTKLACVAPIDAGPSPVTPPVAPPVSPPGAPPATPATCTYDGGTYVEGQSFPSSDGCNTCSCEANGAVLCTKRACAVDAGPATSCTYGGLVYADGAQFPSTDGCNDCSCVAGHASCTKRACRRDAGAP
jgi:hypothetical protein